MPHRVWKHRCPATAHTCGHVLPSGELLLGTDVCGDCGRTGVFDGWHYSMNEMMGTRQLLTGFKPIGAHLPLVDRLLPTRHCEACAGRGLLGPNEPRGWHNCAACNGLGSLLAATPAEVAEIRRRILAEFPDSGAADPAPATGGKPQGES